MKARLCVTLALCAAAPALDVASMYVTAAPWHTVLSWGPSVCLALALAITCLPRRT